MLVKHNFDVNRKSYFQMKIFMRIITKIPWVRFYGIYFEFSYRFIVVLHSHKCDNIEIM